MSAINQTEFESLRTALLNNYSLQTTNHVGYVIALTAGIFVLISSKAFLKFYKNHKTQSLLALSFPISLIEYFLSQIVFWAWMSTTVLLVTENEALSMREPTVIAGIQAYLATTFRNTNYGLSLQGISSAIYGLDQRVEFGIFLSFILLFALTFSIIGIFRICSEHCHVQGRWFEYMILVIMAIIAISLILYLLL